MCVDECRMCIHSILLTTIIKYLLSVCVLCTRHCSRCLGYISEQNEDPALEKLAFYVGFVYLEGMDMFVCMCLLCTHV